MCIDLGRSQGGVTQELLNGSEFGSAVEHVGGAGVSQSVRGGAGAYGGELLFDDGEDVAVLKRSAIFGDQEGGGAVGGAQVEVCADVGGELWAEWDDAFAAAFAHDAERAGGEVDVGGAQGGEFGRSHAGGIEQIDHQAVAAVDEVGAVGVGVDCGLGDGGADGSRQGLGQARGGDFGGGVCGEAVAQHQVVEECAQGLDFAAD